MKNSEINIAIAEITHRYPDQGYPINNKCSELAEFVLMNNWEVHRM